MPMKDLNKQAVDTIAKAIESIFDIQKDKLYYDKTLQGRITAILGNSNYNIAVQGAEYTAIPCSVDMVFAVNESVWVTLPQGDFSDMFVSGRRIN